MTLFQHIPRDHEPKDIILATKITAAYITALADDELFRQNEWCREATRLAGSRAFTNGGLVVLHVDDGSMTMWGCEKLWTVEQSEVQCGSYVTKWYLQKLFMLSVTYLLFLVLSAAQALMR
jgi:hypothetical protein